MRRVRVTVSGAVQGVAFRWGTSREAERAGVSGWVRNVGTDRVEAELEGDAAAVETVIEWMSHGPVGARVDTRNVDELVPRGESGFEVRLSE